MAEHRPGVRGVIPRKFLEALPEELIARHEILVSPSLVVGTTKYSEQNHNPKEKGFKLKEHSRLKSHESFSEFTSKTGSTFVLALRPIGAVAWGVPSSSLRLVTSMSYGSFGTRASVTDPLLR